MSLRSTAPSIGSYKSFRIRSSNKPIKTCYQAYFGGMKRHGKSASMARPCVGHTISKESWQKYSVLRRHFFEFLVHRYKRKDIGLMEFTPAIIQDFELYLTTVALCAYNTAKGSRFMSLCI